MRTFVFSVVFIFLLFYFFYVFQSITIIIQQTFEQIFNAESLENIPFYLVAGNHDWKGNVSAEIDYSNISPRWNFPDYYYTKVIPVNGDDFNYTLQLIMIDTIILCGGSLDTPQDVQQCRDNWQMQLEHNKEHNIKNNSNLNNLDINKICTLTPQGAADTTAESEEWKFINETLGSSRADFIIVAGHYPIWSIAEHGPTSHLVDKLRPVLLEYDVQLYMNGHDHTMEYIEEEDNPNLGFVTTGAAHVCDFSRAHRNDVPTGSLLYHHCDLGGFVRGSINQTGLTIHYYINNENEPTYSTKTFAPRSQGQYMIDKLNS